MTDDGGLTQAELFDVFSNARRRQTVRYIRAAGGSCQLTPLVDQVAAWENDTDVEDVTRTQRRRVYISLYQTHLPMLADHDIVEWDPDEHAIELRADGAMFEPYLADPSSFDRSWHTIYLAVAAVGAGVALLASLSVEPLSSIPTLAVSGGLILAVLTVACVHHVSRRGRFDSELRVDA